MGNTIIDPLKLEHFGNSILDLIILTTENCNFRCDYCYENKNKKTADDYFNRLKKFIKNRLNELDYLKIGWFGGEPLLKMQEIIKLSEYIKCMLKKEFEKKFYGYISTNGYLLTPEISSTLIDLNTKVFQITLDGTERFHDKTRKLKNGKGTFKEIYNNLLYLHSTQRDFRVNLRIHVYEENKDDISILIKNIDNDFQNDQRFSLYFRPVGDYGQQNFNTYTIISNLEFAKYLNFYRKQISRIHESLSETDDYICYASRPNCFVFRPNYKIAKCTIGLDDEENTIGELQSDGTINFDQSKFRQWISGYVENDVKKIRCPRKFLIGY